MTKKQQVVNKLKDELYNFKLELLLLPKSEIIARAEEIVVKQDIVLDVLSWNPPESTWADLLDRACLLDIFYEIYLAIEVVEVEDEDEKEIEEDEGDDKDFFDIIQAIEDNLGASASLKATETMMGFIKKKREKKEDEDKEDSQNEST